MQMIAPLSVHCLREDPACPSPEVSHYFCVVYEPPGFPTSKENAHLYTNVYVYSADPRKQYRLPAMRLKHARQYWRWLIQNGNARIDEHEMHKAKNFRIVSTLCRDEFVSRMRADLYQGKGMCDRIGGDIEPAFLALQPLSQADDILFENQMAAEKCYGLFKICCFDLVGSAPGECEWRNLAKSGDKSLASLIADFLIEHEHIPDVVLSHICDHLGNREAYGLGKVAYSRSPVTGDHPLLAMILSCMTKKSGRSTKSFKYLSEHLNNLLRVEQSDGGLGFGAHPKGRRVGPTSGIG
jgi:hypothetical protein